MAASSRDRISVDMRGLKAALVERARVQGVSPSNFIRAALSEALGRRELFDQVRGAAPEGPGTGARARLCLRMKRDEARATLLAARAARMAPGAFVAGLVAGVPVLVNGAGRADHLAALVASSAELATLCRNIHHLTSLLRQGSVRAAQEYREMLDGVASDVRRHLKLASAALADLEPRRSSLQASSSRPPTTQRRVKCPSPPSTAS